MASRLLAESIDPGTGSPAVADPQADRRVGCCRRRRSEPHPGGGRPVIDRMVIFGAAGDLTARYLVPALARLHQAGQLPEGLGIVGVSREDWDTGRFRR